MPVSEPENLFDPAHYVGVRRPLLEATSLPPWCYTSERFYERELTTIFRAGWHLVGREDELEETGIGEESAGGRDKMAVLGNAMEALIAAVYLDGGYDAARDMILRIWEPQLGSVTSIRKDAKTALQEWAQARGLPSPVYREKERSGPDHEPVFVMEVEVQGEKGQAAEGASKRIAEQSAAEALLRRKKIWRAAWMTPKLVAEWWL